MNAAQLSRSVLLNKLRDFYSLVVKLKNDVEADPAEVSVERVQGELRTYMEDSLRALEGGDDVGYHLFDAMRYVMVALADDAFLHLTVQWPGRAAWLGNLLEKQTFGTQRAGVAFFDNVDELLASRDKSKEEVATAYLIALLLGFKGRFRGQDEDGIVSYRERLSYFVALAQSGGLDPSKPAFPDAYDHTITKEPNQKMPDHRPYLRWMMLVFVAYFAVSHVWWYLQTNEVRTVVEAVNSQTETARPAVTPPQSKREQ